MEGVGLTWSNNYDMSLSSPLHKGGIPTCLMLVVSVWCECACERLVPRFLRGRSREPGTHCLCMLSNPRVFGN